MTHGEQFQALVNGLHDTTSAHEHFTFSYNAEASDFIRFNHAKVRQAGHVQQAQATLTLIAEERQASIELTLAGDLELDHQRVQHALSQLRQTLPLLPPDPYLQINPQAWHSQLQQDVDLPGVDSVVAQIGQAAADLDLVGIYAAGPIYRGFASSSGAFGWHQATSFNFDFSVFHANGQAVKANYAGQQWQAEVLQQRLQQAREQLVFLGRPLKTLVPGEYRAYLAPAALDEIIGMLSWGGFSAQAIASKSSPLQRLYAGEQRLSTQVNWREQVSDSLSPAFSGEGYPRSDLALVVEGRSEQRLVDSRSAAEYGLPCNGANGGESPGALQMGAGKLPQAQVLQALGTGLYVSNLWYLNYSDLPAARMTGLTRFATFWVENGEIVAPVSTMRFDDSAFSLLGSALEALTCERELMLTTSTYGQRQTSSTLLPGALVSRLTLTL